MRTFISTVATAILFLFFTASAEAQPQGKVLNIGFLSVRPSVPGGGFELIGSTLRDLGYVEEKNIVFNPRYAENNVYRLFALAVELVRLKVDVLIAEGSLEARAAKYATRTIPIIFLFTADDLVGLVDPVQLGLVDSLARPGGNVTGITDIGAILTRKRLELLKETVPKLSRVAVLWDPEDRSSRRQWRESQLPAGELGLQIHSMMVSTADQYMRAFSEARKAGSAALAVTLSQLNNSNQGNIADLAAKHRLPAIYPRGDFAESGGLMSYADDPAEPYRRVAFMVDKILKGTMPAELPIEQPTKFELVINRKTATQLDLAFPVSILKKADRVIK